MLVIAARLRGGNANSTLAWPASPPRHSTTRAARCNLLRDAGALASLAHSKAHGATIVRDLIHVAACTAR